jgi:N-acetylglutamate synthase-like GNAT family acetyltransferase
MPVFMVAMQDDMPVGCVSLVEHDMSPERLTPSPWLASLYVKPDCRNKGIGLRLQQECLRKAYELGTKTLYLFTPNKEQHYLRSGWQTIEHTEFRTVNVVIMAQETAGK